MKANVTRMNNQNTNITVCNYDEFKNEDKLMAEN